MQKLMSLVGVIVCFLVITGFFVTQRITDFKSPPQNIHTSALGNNIRFYDNYYDQSEWPWINHYTESILLTITESKTTMSEWGIDWEDMAKKAMAVDESNMPRCRDEEWVYNLHSGFFYECKNFL